MLVVHLWVTVLLGEPKIDEVDEIGLLSEPNQEVVGLDISVNIVFRVHVLYSVDLYQYK